MKIPARYIFILSLLLALAVTPVAASAFSISKTILSFVGLLTGLGGLLLNAAVQHLVLGMGTFLGGALNEPLNLTWVMVRDLVNLTFIFGLIYAGVLMILGIDASKAKKLVASIVVSALLVNFSLFISKVVIDVSNLASAHIYATMVQHNSKFADWNTIGLSGAFMGQMGLLKLASPDLQQNAGNSLTNLGSDETSLPYVLIASIFLLVAAFVFAAGALLLAIRFGMLVLLMVLSPVAFVSSLLPGIGGLSKKWWHALFSQAFFAPAYLFVLYIAWRLIERANNQGLTNDSLVSIFNSGGLAAAGRIVILYVILIVMLVAALVIAKNIGAYGASTALSVGKKMQKSIRGGIQGTVLRPLVGGAASGLNKLNNRLLATAGGRRASTALSIASLGALSQRNRQNMFKAGKNAKFGSNYSYEDDKKFKDEMERTAVAEERKLKRKQAQRKYEEQQKHGAYGSDEYLSARGEAAELTSNMTLVELEELSIDELRQISHLLSNKQMDQIKDSKVLTDAVKDAVKESRKMTLETEFKETLKLNDGDAGAFFRGMKAADIAKLPKAILKSQESFKYMTGDVMRRVHDDGALSQDEAHQLAEAMRAAAHADPSGVGYMDGPRGQSFYGQRTSKPGGGNAQTISEDEARTRQRAQARLE